MDDPAAPHIDGQANAIDWLCFAYLTAEKSELYRAIVDAFAAAKAEFLLHMRPAQIEEMVCAHEHSTPQTDIEAALQQLESWGNLQSYQDNADVASLSDFYQKRLLYQLSAAGEAAHASTLTFVERLQQQAKLDARALERIADGVGQLEKLACQIRAALECRRSGDASHTDTDTAGVDSVVVLTVVRSICQDADELTSRAQSFFRWLHEQTESDRGDLEAFLSYKERLIEYLQQFVSELITRGGEIAKRLCAITDAEYERLAHVTAAEEVGAPRAGEEAEHADRVAGMARRWQQRLFALRGWFSASGGRSSQLEQLRAAARAAIPRLLQLAGQMNERQSGRSDRVADLRALAEQFLSCRNDAEAHRLYRAAFAISPARHLRIDQATIEWRDQNYVSAKTRWLDAEPVEFAPQLRKTGREPVVTGTRRVVDRSKQRAAAERRLNTDAGRVDSSRETLIALGKCKLSDIGQLDTDSFRLMMELIELAVPSPDAKTPHVVATSRDGRVRIEVCPIEDAASERGYADHERDNGSTKGRFRTQLDGPVMDEATSPSRLDRSRAGLVASSTTNGFANRQTSQQTCFARLRSPAGHIMLPDMWVEVTRGR